MTTLRWAAAVAVALTIPLAAPNVAAADPPRASFVTFAPGQVATVRVPIGVESAISFGPNERITFAQIDDAVRWEAHEDPPARAADNAPVARVGVVPAEAAQAYLTVRTMNDGSERLYRLRLIAVPRAPSQVAFVYPRAFVGGASAASASVPPAVAATAAPAGPVPPASLAIAPAAALAAVQPASPAAVPVPILATAATPAAAPPFAVAAPSTPPNPCPNQGKVSQSLRTVGVVSQVVDAAMVAKALRTHSFTHAVLGAHTLVYYLAELAAEDYAVHAIVRHACPNTQNAVTAILAGAAIYNAASIPTVTHP